MQSHCDQTNCNEPVLFKGKCSNHARMICKYPCCFNLKSISGIHCGKHRLRMANQVYTCVFLRTNKVALLCESHLVWICRTKKKSARVFKHEGIGGCFVCKVVNK